MLKRKIVFSLLLGIALTFSVPTVNAFAAVQNGWEQTGSDWYYYEGGVKQTNKWIAGTGTNSDKWYYVGSNGVMVKNDWVKHTDGKWYYLGSDGAMITNQWIPGANNNGKWYYVGEDGAMKTNSWIEGHGKYYGLWYYVDGDGAMVTNKWVYGNGGNSYYLGDDGAMLTNTVTPDGYYVGSDGAYIAPKQTLWMESTAYCDAGKTASGRYTCYDPQGISTIAVDPNVIPLGSLVKVEGYGIAVAADTGSAIKGKIIDVFFNDYSQAQNWGRKYDVKVEVLAYNGEW